MAVEAFAPFPRIVEHVKELCTQGRTGTLFLVSEDNRMALMRFEAGAIVTIVHRNRRGLEALAAVCEIKSAKLRFDVASVAPIETHDLATKDILDHLEKVARQMPSPAASPDIPRPASFSPEVKLAVQKIMMKYVGLKALGRGLTEDRIWISMERHMQCAVGLCGHCQWGPTFVCKDGPVFRFDAVRRWMAVENL